MAPSQTLPQYLHNFSPKRQILTKLVQISSRCVGVLYWNNLQMRSSITFNSPIPTEATILTKVLAKGQKLELVQKAMVISRHFT